MRTDLATKAWLCSNRPLACVILALFFFTGLGMAQGSRAGGRRPKPKTPRAQRPLKDQHQHGPGFLKRLRDLPPEQQERVLANDERFQRLPLERQAQIREHLRQWNALSTEEKERLREREEIFESLSPGQRQEARTLFQQWRSLPPERRQALMQAFRHLRDLPPAERQQFLSGPEVEKRFKPEERNLLGGMSRLLPESRGEEADESED